MRAGSIRNYVLSFCYPDSEVIEDSIDSNCDLFVDVTSVELTKRKNRDANTSRSHVSKAKSRRPSRSRSPDSSLQSDSLSCSCGKVFTSLRQIRGHPVVKTPLLIVTVENLLFSLIVMKVLFNYSMSTWIQNVSSKSRPPYSPLELQWI
jgi:hypothetical protein